MVHSRQAWSAVSRLGGAIGLLVAGLLLVSGCGDETLRQGDVERFIARPLPAGSRDLRATGQSGIDRLVLARFEAPDAEVEAFALALGGEGLVPGLDPGLPSVGEGIEGWPRSLPDRFAGATRHDPAANRSYRLLATPSLTPGISTVFLVAFSL